MTVLEIESVLLTIVLRQHPRSHNDNSVMHVIALEFGKYKGMDFFIFFD